MDFVLLHVHFLYHSHLHNTFFLLPSKKEDLISKHNLQQRARGKTESSIISK